MHIETTTTDWFEFPPDTGANGQLIAIPDIHGRADLLQVALKHVAALPGPKRDMERTMVFLGDLIDRGPHSIEVIQMAMAASFGGKPAIILPGNHEGMMMDGFDLAIDTGAFHFWYECGGEAVINQLPCGGRGSPEELRDKVRALVPAEFIKLLRGGGPTHHVSGDLMLVHAGIPPFGLDMSMYYLGEDPYTLEAFLAQPLQDAPRMLCAWMREPFLTWKGGWDAERRRIVVHGHSVEHDGAFEDEAHMLRVVDRIDDQRRIGLDIGSVSYDRIVMLEAIEGRYRFHKIQQHKYLP